MQLDDIKFREIQLFLALIRLRSVRELARQTHMQPGQVSKLLQSLEKKLGFPLVERSMGGIRPTPKALELLPQLERINSLKEKLADSYQSEDPIQTLTLASSSFFSTYVVPAAIRELRSQDLKVRVIDLPPTQFISAALRGTFEYCIHAQPLDWPRTWTTEEIGSMPWRIYSRKGHPVLKTPSLKEVLRYPFVVPIYWTSDGVQNGDDECPVPANRRKRGHETATAASAAEIMKVTDQLGFLPDLVAQKHQLEAVPVPGWKPLKKPVYLSVKNSTVKQRQFELLTRACREALKTF